MNPLVERSWGSIKPGSRWAKQRDRDMREAVRPMRRGQSGNSSWLSVAVLRRTRCVSFPHVQCPYDCLLPVYSSSPFPGTSRNVCLGFATVRRVLTRTKQKRRLMGQDLKAIMGSPHDLPPYYQGLQNMFTSCSFISNRIAKREVSPCPYKSQ